MPIEYTFDYRDEFLRKPIAEKLIALLNSDINLSPLVIDGGWGTGKTEFCKKVANLIENNNQKHKVVYIDAFAEDHNDAPILTLMAGVAALLPEDKRKELISKTLPAIRFGLKTIFKAGTGWVLKQNADDIVDGFEDAIKEATSSAIDSTIETLLDDHIEAQKNIETLRNTISQLTEKFKITIIIDELDRCKPTFALSIIENIKHIFEIKNLNFVLVAKTQQLKASISHLYGLSINAEQYLDKFIKFTFVLPDTFKPDNYTPAYASVALWEILKNDSQRLQEVNEECGHIIKTIIQRAKLSLREVETLSRHFEIYQVLSQSGIGPEKIFGYSLYRTLGVMLYSLNRPLALSYLDNSVDAESTIKTLGFEYLSYDDDIYSVDNTEYAIYGIVLDYIDATSPFFIKDDETRKKWTEHATYSFFQKGLNTVPPRKLVSSAIEVLMLN
ncbi:KAP family NTPase [Escherichia coli]|nr:KAP family NTPase [Escherichia coli]